MDIRTASDGDLAGAVANGDPAEAQAELYRRLAPRVRAYGLKHLGDRGQADDLVQSVLLTAIGKLQAGEVREPEHIVSFVLGTCRRAVQEGHRRNARRRDLLAAAAPHLRELAVCWQPTERIDRDRLARCLAGLSQRQRTVVMLSFFAEQSGPEIAAELAISAANVRVLRHRALAALHDCVTRGQP